MESVSELEDHQGAAPQKLAGENDGASDYRCAPAIVAHGNVGLRIDAHLAETAQDVLQEGQVILRRDAAVEEEIGIRGGIVEPVEFPELLPGEAGHGIRWMHDEDDLVVLDHAELERARVHRPPGEGRRLRLPTYRKLKQLLGIQSEEKYLYDWPELGAAALDEIVLERLHPLQRFLERQTKVYGVFQAQALDKTFHQVFAARADFAGTQTLRSCQRDL